MCQLVMNRPSSEIKKPVPVRSSFPDSSKTETKITAGLTRSATSCKAGEGVCAIGAGETCAPAGVTVAAGADTEAAVCDGSGTPVYCGGGFRPHHATAKIITRMIPETIARRDGFIGGVDLKWYR